MDCGDPFFLKRGIDADAADISVQHIRIDPPLYDRRRQVYTLGREHLDERLGDNPAAHVATARSGNRKVPRLIDIYSEIYSHALGSIQKEVGEKRTCRPASDHGHLRTVVQLEIGCVG